MEQPVSSTTRKCALVSNPHRLLFALIGACWLTACGDDDAKPPGDLEPDAAAPAGIDASAPGDTSSTSSNESSSASQGGSSAADTEPDASAARDAGSETSTDGSKNTSSDESNTGQTSETSETTAAESTTDPSSDEASSDESSEETSSDESESSDISDAGLDGGAEMDAGFPWDAGSLAIGRNETRVLTDFDIENDGGVFDTPSLISPNVKFANPISTSITYEVSNSVGRFTFSFTAEAKRGEGARVQFTLPGNYATHNLRVRLRVVEAFPNTVGAAPTLQLFSYSGGGKWNSLGLTIEPGVWREYTYDLWTQPVFPEVLESLGFRVGTGVDLGAPDDVVVEVDWVKIEPKP